MGRMKPGFNNWNDGVLYTRNLILRGMSAVYLCAFLTFYYQSPGLFGKNGIVPAYLQFNSNKGAISAIHRNPTLLHFASYIGLDVDYMMDVLALLGILISFTSFISQTFCLLPTFAALWSLYYSLVQVMQVFGNQSDLLLLEAGFICLMISPLNSSHKSSVSDKIGIAMIKWCLFRFMFDSGAVKFFSGCPQWWRFAGLSFHFETLPLPTAFSWYCYYLPSNFMKVTNIYTNLTELVCPWFFYFPSRAVRILLFHWVFYLQLTIIISGNYGFLNFLVSTLLLSLLDDEYLENRSFIRLLLDTLIACFAFTMILFGATVMFPGHIEKLVFEQEHVAILRSLTKLSPLVPLVAVIATFLTNLVSHPSITLPKGFLRKISDINALLAFTLCSLALVGISVVPHNNLDSAMNITNTQLGKYYHAVNKYHIVNEYGRHLRKMRTERYEVTLEYTQDVNESWNELKFLFKPWSISQYPPFAGPYLPRLDIKFYETSIGNYREHSWILALVYRILQNEPTVLKLFGIENSLEPNPKYVRGILNKFKYTPLNEFGDNFWNRRVMREYFPAFSIDNPTLQAYLANLKITGKSKPQAIKNSFLKNILDFIRQQAFLMEGHILLQSVLIAGLVIIYLKKQKNYT